MRSEIIWGKWYTLYVRVVVHIIFWMLVFCTYYFTYRRLGGSYIWILVAKELFVTTSLFYSGIWLVSKWVEKRKGFPFIIFIILSYIWWLNITYLVCDMLNDFVSINYQVAFHYLLPIFDFSSLLTAPFHHRYYN